MKQSTLQHQCYLWLAALALAACSKDDLAEQAGTLPDGQYPLQIGSVILSVEGGEEPWGAKSPQTRVSEKTDGSGSRWTEGDVFHVKFENDDRIGEYEYENGAWTAVTPLYWTSTEAADVLAWHVSPSAAANGGTVELDLSDQSQGLAYVLRAEAKDASFQSAPVSLEFTHQLSKVRVYVRGTAYDGDATGVTINTCPASCTVSNGAVTSSGANGEIQMYRTTVNGETCFEANVPAGTLAKEGAFTVTLQGENTHTFSLEASMTLKAANYHNATLNLQKAGTHEINLSGGGRL